MQEEIVPQNDNQDNNIQEDDEGLVVVRNDNIVSEQEDFIEESEDEDAPTGESEPEGTTVVAALDDNTEIDTIQQNSRPRRTNIGSGVDRLHMCFEGKGYGSQREFNLITNGKTETYNIHDHKHKTYMTLYTILILLRFQTVRNHKDTVKCLPRRDSDNLDRLPRPRW